MILDTKKALDEFIKERPKKFPIITLGQFERWLKSIEEFLKQEISDSDIFYDCIPEDIEDVELNEAINGVN